MPLISMTALLKQAMLNGYALGYFETWDSYSLEAVLEAAEAEQSPVILGFGGMMADRGWLDAGGVEMLGAMGAAVPRRSSVAVSFFVNKAQTFYQDVAVIHVRFHAAMLDPASVPLDKVL